MFGMLAPIMPALIAICALGGLSVHIMTSSRLCFVGARNGSVPHLLMRRYPWNSAGISPTSSPWWLLINSLQSQRWSSWARSPWSTSQPPMSTGVLWKDSFLHISESSASLLSCRLIDYAAFVESMFILVMFMQKLVIKHWDPFSGDHSWSSLPPLHQTWPSTSNQVLFTTEMAEVTTYSAFYSPLWDGRQ